MKLEQASQQELLRALSKATGYQTQLELACWIGVTQPAVSKWLTGSRTMTGPIRKLICKLIEEEI